METESTTLEQSKVKSSIVGSFNYLKDLMTAGPEGPAGRGVEMGLSAVLARTALKRLPPPFNLVAPLLVERVLMKHGVEEGRELLLKGLRWVKKATDEKPATAS
ncbi:hypothetical protein [Dyadobacter sp. MSC1_007]|jgi:hypothetical protein|uniref:hypothetical protein n=1 Tax=Dyadobacter sp. MSC1_007 TaxID=2909264 RepID=UPI00202F8669|nr:hypothetical protein [Dyadobacter sp. MSC1_007]